jgi:NADPH:quinone reductase-like Zn-dependent oxidoreductase
MKAFMRHTYGSPDVLELTEIETPTPKDDEVLIKIHAASVNAADWRMLRADPFLARLDVGLIKPRNKILGFDVAGTVEAAGRAVKQFRPGDHVLGNLFDLRGGAFAEYVAVPEKLLVHKPANVTFEQAAAVPLAAVTALRGLRHYAQVRPGHKVLIVGASGGVGSFAVQIARALGAEVTAVVSTRNVELARSLGADHVIDYTREDPLAGAEGRYDVILAVNGYHPIAAYRRALRPGGIYVMAGGSEAQFFQAMLLGAWVFRTGERKLRMLETKPTTEDLAFVADLIAAGQVKPVVDRCYPLEALPEAFRYIEAGHARGKVVIGVAG